MHRYQQPSWSLTHYVAGTGPPLPFECWDCTHVHSGVFRVYPDDSVAFYKTLITESLGNGMWKDYSLSPFYCLEFPLYYWFNLNFKEEKGFISACLG